MKSLSINFGGKRAKRGKPAGMGGGGGGGCCHKTQVKSQDVCLKRNFEKDSICKIRRDIMQQNLQYPSFSQMLWEIHVP